MKRSSYPFQIMLGFLGLLIGLLVYGVWWVNHWSPEEARTMGAARALRDAVDEFIMENGAYPAELAACQPFLTDGRWPDNPYSGGPLADTGSAAFDPQASPGNVYYQRIYNAPEGEGYDVVLADRRPVGYVIIVFGAKGQIWTYRGRVRPPAD